MIYHTLTGNSFFDAQGFQTDGQLNIALYSSHPSPKSPPTVIPTSIENQHPAPQASVIQYQWPQFQPEMHYLRQPTTLVASDAVSQEGHYVNTHTSCPQQPLSPGSLETEHFKFMKTGPLKALGLFSSLDDIYSSGNFEFSGTKAVATTTPTGLERPTFHCLSRSGQLSSSCQTATPTGLERPTFHSLSRSGQLSSSCQRSMPDALASVYEPVHHDFIYRSPEFGGLSSPEVVSPASEHSLLGVSEEDSYFTFVPGAMQTPQSTAFDHLNFASGSFDPTPSTISIPPLARLPLSSSSVQYFPDASMTFSQPFSVGTQAGSLSDLDPAMDSSNEMMGSTSRRRKRAVKNRPLNKILVKYSVSDYRYEIFTLPYKRRLDA
ncbi:hypothetical protein EC968_000561 [Mortierella alpina]|nr:hypothetical protein EC968_000561 [Mortierella alpina]